MSLFVLLAWRRWVLKYFTRRGSLGSLGGIAAYRPSAFTYFLNNSNFHAFASLCTARIGALLAQHPIALCCDAVRQAALSYKLEERLDCVGRLRGFIHVCIGLD